MPDVISVLDSSSLMDIKSKIPTGKRKALFQALSAMVLEDRLVMPAQVVEEMRRGADPKHTDEALDWVLSAESRAVVDVDIDHVKLVMERVGDVIDHQKESGVDEADPYVLALALALRDQGHAVRVVTEDRHDRAKLSLTTAAGVLDITAVPLLGFIRAERIL